MAVKVQDGKLIYHITALENIESILQNGLKSRAVLNEPFVDVANQEIINFRDRNGISDHIPFHFFIGSPFAGTIQKDNPTTEFIYIAISRNVAQKNNFKIIPTHPIHMEPLKIFDFSDGLEAINWELMELRDYSIHECKEVCMAECIAPYSRIGHKVFQSIIVKSDITKTLIIDTYKRLYNTTHNPPFHVNVNDKCFIG